jgi:catalase
MRKDKMKKETLGTISNRQLIRNHPIKDPQKRDNRVNCKNPVPKQEFCSMNPKILHQVHNKMRDQGTQFLNRHQFSFGCHAFFTLADDGRITIS